MIKRLRIRIAHTHTQSTHIQFDCRSRDQQQQIYVPIVPHRVLSHTVLRCVPSSYTYMEMCTSFAGHITLPSRHHDENIFCCLCAPMLAFRTFVVLAIFLSLQQYWLFFLLAFLYLSPFCSLISIII